MASIKNIVVDIGNTRSKAAVFEGTVLLEKIIFKGEDVRAIEVLLENYHPATSLISSVGIKADTIIEMLKTQTICFELTPELPVPFHNLYATPHTLGMDRVAGVTGAMHFFSKQNCLVIDMGTCVTYDFITAGADYLGGAISPGLHMRLQAMAHFTQRLPELAFEKPVSFIGNSTQNSMLAGAYYGLLGEINETIQRYDEQFWDVQVILCGGDAELFDKHTKKSIFAAPDLVLYGLNNILDYNANKGQ